MKADQTEITRLKGEVKRLEESNAARQKRWEQLLVERNSAIKERDEQAKKFADLEKLYQERELAAGVTVKKMTDLGAALAAELELVDKAAIAYCPEVNCRVVAERPNEDRAAPIKPNDRVAQLGSDAQKLWETARLIHEVLWPADNDIPDTLHGMSLKLDDAPEVLERLQDTAARGGAEQALAQVLAWYDGVDLDKVGRGFPVGQDLASVRAGTPSLRLNALRIGSYVDFDDAPPPPTEAETAIILGGAEESTQQPPTTAQDSELQQGREEEQRDSGSAAGPTPDAPAA